jgi:hypothetical protein
MMLQITRRRAAVFLLVACAALAAQLAPTATAQSGSQDTAKPGAHPTSVGGINSATGQNVGSQTPAKPGAASTSKPGQEGLTVHGYWKIDVHNPDGKLVTHREFENSLTGGAPQLYQLITGQAAAGDMAIVVNNGTTQPDICHAGTSSDNCYLVISETSGIGGNLCVGGNAVYCTAGLTEITNGASGVVTLSGNLLAAQTTVISAVSTFLLTCSFTTSGFATISPTQCFALNGSTGTPTQPVLTSYGPFTGTTLPTTLPVTVGQTVTFQVVFTFS